MATCRTKNGVLFFLSEGPYVSARNYHLLRTALSVVLDAKPLLVLQSDAVRLAVCNQDPSPPLNDVVAQLRMLREMEVLIYVVEEDLAEHRITNDQLISGIKVLPAYRIHDLMDEMRYVLVA